MNSIINSISDALLVSGTMRNYQKKGNSYTNEELQKAIQDVERNERSVRQAAKDLGISHDTLRRKIIANVDAENVEDMRGKKTVLTMEEEAKLADYLRTLAKWGFGLTKEELLCVVSDYCHRTNTSNRFKNGKPGQEWFTNFCKRNNMKIKNTERLEKKRQKNTSDPFLIYEFYDLLEKLASELDLQSKPDHWWNLDECGVCHDPTKCKALAGKEQTNIYRTDQGPGRENTTVMACVNACGRKLAPLFIFKAAKLWSTWRGTEDIPGTFYAVAENGFITSDIFYDYIQKFCRTVRERPLILIVDGHIFHLDLRTVNLAKKENIAVVKLPSHTTDLLQPLDRTCFGPFKKRWNAALVNWQRLNQRMLNKSEFVNLVCSVWDEGLSELNIVSGFRSCGIFPLNREKYPMCRLNPTKLQLYLASKEDRTSDVTASGEQDAPRLDNQPVMIDVPAPEELELPDQLDTDGVFFDSNGIAGEEVVIVEADTNEVTNPPTSTIPKVNIVGQNTTVFEELLLKKIGATAAPKEKRRIIPSNAAVITSEEFISSIQEVHNGKKQAKSTKRKNKTTDHIHITKRGRGKENNAPPQTEEEENNESVREGNYIVAWIDGKKEVCRIEKVSRNLEDAMVMWFSKIEETDSYEMAVPCYIKFTDVVKKISSPTVIEIGPKLQYVFEAIS